MEVEIIKSEKDLLELKVDNQTVAEILRAYLNQRVNGVKFAAWREEHQGKPLVFKIETSDKTAKKAVVDAITEIEKDFDYILKGLKK